MKLKHKPKLYLELLGDRRQSSKDTLDLFQVGTFTDTSKIVLTL